MLLLIGVELFIGHTNGIRKKWGGKIPGLIISGLLVCFWRNDGIYMVAPPLFCLIFVEKGRFWKRFLLSLAIVVSVYVGFIKVALPSMNIAPTERIETLSLPVQQTARYLKAYPNDVTNHEKHILATTFKNPEKLREIYVPNNADPVKFSLRKKFNLRKYAKVWLDMGLRHPGVYLSATFAGTNGYYVPWILAPDFTWCGAMADYAKPTFLHMHYVTSAKVRNRFIQIIGSAGTVPFINIFFSTSIAIWLCLLMALLMWTKYGFRFIVPIIPIFMNLLICIASPVNGLVRYSGCTVFATFMLIIYYLYILKFGKKKGEPND